jgi:hypothetical protein
MNNVTFLLQKQTINLLHFYTSTTSSFQIHLHILLTPLQKFISLSRNSTKLDGDLHLILGSLEHLLLININFSNF